MHERQRWVGWDESRYTIVYPCAGFLADPPPGPEQASLAKLIGPVRAQILTTLVQPRSTSQLVALTGYTLGSVGGHLKVLLDAGLVRKRRAGRSVSITAHSSATSSRRALVGRCIEGRRLRRIVLPRSAGRWCH